MEQRIKLTEELIKEANFTRDDMYILFSLIDTKIEDIFENKNDELNFYGKITVRELSELYFKIHDILCGRG